MLFFTSGRLLGRLAGRKEDSGTARKEGKDAAPLHTLTLQMVVVTGMLLVLLVASRSKFVDVEKRERESDSARVDNLQHKESQHRSPAEQGSLLLLLLLSGTGNTRITRGLAASSVEANVVITIIIIIMVIAFRSIPGRT